MSSLFILKGSTAYLGTCFTKTKTRRQPIWKRLIKNPPIRSLDLRQLYCIRNTRQMAPNTWSSCKRLFVYAFLRKCCLFVIRLLKMCFKIRKQHYIGFVISLMDNTTALFNGALSELFFSIHDSTQIKLNIDPHWFNLTWIYTLTTIERTEVKLVA